MTDYKMEAAKAAAKLIKAGQIIGLGAGATIANIIEIISKDAALVATLTFTSSSFKTTALLNQYGLRIVSPALLNKVDIYFDGCDQFDTNLNALKSGGGIHTTEKILASMADEFIIVGDAAKFIDKLGTTYPLVIEVLHAALQIVLKKLTDNFPIDKLNVRISTQKDGPVVSDDGNLLIDIHFTHLIPLDQLNIQIKMIPGIVEHSLFYQLAKKAIIAGSEGVRTITPQL